MPESMHPDNTVKNVSEIFAPDGELIVRITREYGPKSSPSEAMALEKGLLAIAESLTK